MSDEILKFGDFEIPKQAYLIKFSNGEDLIIEFNTFRQILEQLDSNQDILLFKPDNSMINLNQIVSIKPLKHELNPGASLLEKMKKLKDAKRDKNE